MTLSKLSKFSDLSAVKEKNNTDLARLLGGLSESLCGAWHMAGLSSINDGFVPCPVPIGFLLVEKVTSGCSSRLYSKNVIQNEFST